MDSRPTGTARRSVTAALTAAVLLWPSIEPVAAKMTIAAATDTAPCSERYMRAAVPELAPTPTGADAVRRAFDPSRSWGLENTSVAVPRRHEPPVLVVRYPKGTHAPSVRPRGGVGFRSTIGLDGGVEAACLRYKVQFPDGFDFVKGGKLPGLYGGTAPTGGADADGANGFSMRFMWRSAGRGELYAYIPARHDGYGLSIDRGAWMFGTGVWVTLEQEIVLNDPATANGIARVWVDGTLVVDKADILYRTVDSLKIDGLMFSTFFGGHDASWATPRDQEVWFSDFEVYAPGMPVASVDLPPVL